MPRYLPLYEVLEARNDLQIEANVPEKWWRPGKFGREFVGEVLQIGGRINLELQTGVE